MVAVYYSVIDGVDAWDVGVDLAGHDAVDLEAVSLPRLQTIGAHLHGKLGFIRDLLDCKRRGLKNKTVAY